MINMNFPQKTNKSIKVPIGESRCRAPACVGDIQTKLIFFNDATSKMIYLQFASDS